MVGDPAGEEIDPQRLKLDSQRQNNGLLHLATPALPRANSPSDGVREAMEEPASIAASVCVDPEQLPAAIAVSGVLS